MLVTRDAEFVVVPWRADLANIVPHARRLSYGGEDYLVLPNRSEEARVARNLGVPVPAPILTRYHWPASDGRVPWEIQKHTAALLSESPRAYVLSTMGTGKTRAAAWAAHYLQTTGPTSGLPWLIAAPLSTLSCVWEQELFKLFPQARVAVLHAASREKRLKLLAQDADFYIVNHHGLDLLKDALADRHLGGVIIDELAVFRNKSTGLWKAANAVVSASPYAWGLTGSPTPQAPTDAWAQVRLLTPNRVARTMTLFRDQTMRQITTFKWIPRDDANETVRAAMQPSVRYVLEDVAELPETVYLDREVKLDQPVKDAYRILHKKLCMMTNHGHSVTAVNEGVLQIKLLQVALGWIYTDKGTVYQLPGTARLDALNEVIDEVDAERKIIVFVPFIHALEGVAAELIRHGETVGVVHGSTSRISRDKIFREFQHGNTPRVLVAHPQCMAHGLTLTAANTVVWFGPAPSLEIYEQANARIVRPSQTSKTLIVHLHGSPVETASYARLKARSKMQGMLLELFKNQEVEF